MVIPSLGEMNAMAKRTHSEPHVVSEAKLAEGFTCECGEYHKYPAYVFAHWRTPLTHSCDKCQRQHTVIMGMAMLKRSRGKGEG